VANMPFRVRGGSVAGDFGAALALSGGGPAGVEAVAWISYPDARTHFLDHGRGEPVRRDPAEGFVFLRVPAAPFCRDTAPGSFSDGVARSPAGKVFFDDSERLRIRVDTPPDSGRAAYAWVGGRLEPLAGAAPR